MPRREVKIQQIQDELNAEKPTDEEARQDKFDQDHAIFEERFNGPEGNNIGFVWKDKTTNDVSSLGVTKRAIELANTDFLKKYGHWGAPGHGLEGYYYISDVKTGHGDSSPLGNKYGNKAQLIQNNSYFLIKI